MKFDFTDDGAVSDDRAPALGSLRAPYPAARCGIATILFPLAFPFVPGGTIPNHVSASFGVPSSRY